ncbi:hypothetical protein [Rhizobacter sp. OV335]|uniref:hypothetical protein n=1 Tax=Rhizobacter sp. OV335 TaxID=1500264 RepID=UPI000913F84C|nr:hypothetical protein [Rhizobacter sp. OV335]SHN29278.1 hypothetical protein SAMN02787076_04850 [Rhizobacter sp. OV335]
MNKIRSCRLGPIELGRFSRTNENEPSETTLTYNIDTNLIRAEEGYARETHPQWRVNTRIELVKGAVGSILAIHRPMVVNIQECRKCETRFGDTVDSVTPLVELFESHGYRSLVMGYNEAGGDKGFKFITAYDPQKLTLERSYMRYLTKTPKAPTPRPDTSNMTQAEIVEVQKRIKDHNFGEDWERGVLVTRFKHCDMTDHFYSINVHMAIPEVHRRKAAALLLDFVAEIVAEESNAKIVIQGDFNSFSDRGGPEQLQALREEVFEGEKLLNEATQDLRFPNGEKANLSFIAFPYDLFGFTGRDIKGTDISQVIESLACEDHRQEAHAALARVVNPFNVNVFLAALDVPCRKVMIPALFQRCPALGGILDRVLHRGLDKSAESTVFPVTQFDDASKIASFNDEDSVRQYILDHHEEGPAFASDHQPILTRFTWAGGTASN